MTKLSEAALIHTLSNYSRKCYSYGHVAVAEQVSSPETENS
jgi:hypothetical protein